MRLLVADDVVLVVAALLRSGRGCILGCGVAAVVVVVVVVVFALVVSRVVVLAVVVVVVVAVVHVRCGSVVLVDAVIGAAVADVIGEGGADVDHLLLPLPPAAEGCH